MIHFTRTSHSKQAGFTLIELMIAISVLSLVLLLTTMGIVRIGEAYYKGITQANTQQAARTLIDSVSQNIQFTNFSGLQQSTATLPSSKYGGSFEVRAVCIGLQRYSYVIDYQLSGLTDATSGNPPTSKHVLWKDVTPDFSCQPLDVGEVDNSGAPIGIPTVSVQGANGAELIGENMRLTRFNVTGTGSLYVIEVTIMYGDNDLIDKTGAPADWQCKPRAGLIGASFCAKSELTTTVAKRLN